jgi:hypothetical protein
MSDQDNERPSTSNKSALDRRKILLAGTTLAAASSVGLSNPFRIAEAQAQTTNRKPNILFIMGDDIGCSTDRRTCHVS